MGAGRRRLAVLGLSSAVVCAVAVTSLWAALASAGSRPARGALGWLAAGPAVVDNLHHLYVLDGWGGVHPVGDAPALSTTASWPDKNIAFSLALFPDGTGGYVLDGYGGLHPVGDAPAVDSGVRWPHWIGAREVVLAPWASADAPAGYVLDADGGIHPFGGAPAVTGFATWPSKGIARGLVLAPDSTPSRVEGYSLDGYGGVHAFGGAPPVTDAAAFKADMARGIVLAARRWPLVQGYTLDFSGGIHPFGGAPPVRGSAAWTGRDFADSLVAWTRAPADSPGGWVLDRSGGVHAWGGAPSLTPTRQWPGWDIARGLAGGGSGAGGGSTENLILGPQPRGDSWGAYFNQRDSRWATRPVGAVTYPIWEIGCLLSDLAMVYSHFGFSDVTPATLAAHASWFDGRGAMYNSAISVPGHRTVVSHSPSAGWIAAQVALGRPVIVGMTLAGGGTHFVVLTGRKGSTDYWVDDPWEQNAMHVPFSGDWFTRGPIYEAYSFA
jgi:hypothetical protein